MINDRTNVNFILSNKLNINNCKTKTLIKVIVLWMIHKRIWINAEWLIDKRKNASKSWFNQFIARHAYPEVYYMCLTNNIRGVFQKSLPELCNFIPN